jgi:hypothetical protein
MPRVAAVLGLLRGAGSGCAGGADTIGLQAAAAKIANAALTSLAERMTSPGKGADPEPIGRERALQGGTWVALGDSEDLAPGIETGTERRGPLGWYLSCRPGARHEPHPIHGDSMTRRDDQRIAALAKKNAAKVKPPRQEQAADFDHTLRQRAPEQDAETKKLFKEMKRREF